jgi:hypothetical protein
MDTPRLSLLLLLLVLVALRREGGCGRRGQMRRLKVVCERRKTRESSMRRTGSERERRSRCSGFRAAVIAVVGDEGGVAMELSACCTWAATVMCTYVALVLCT